MYTVFPELCIISHDMTQLNFYRTTIENIENVS